MPFRVMEQFVANVHLPVDSVDVCHTSVGSEMIADVNLCLLCSGAMLTV